ncbi:MAG TPA: glycosyltransferase [Pyrinomonadaceae bacterium]|nr:glycosyltransferase [Pyrinomonadaceae bacterium]
MKIVRIIARLNVGGPARHVTWLNNELRDAEFQSVLVAGTVPAGEEDMSYLATAAPPIYIAEMSRELSWKDAVALYKIYRVLVREKPDIVHTHTAKAGTVGRAAAFLYKLTRPRRKIKVVHTFHGHVFHSYYSSRKTKLFLAIERTLARFATDKIVTISDQQRKEIHSDFGIGRIEQFETISLGIDLDALLADDEHRHLMRTEAGAASDDILVGFVGRLTEIKNLSMFIRVAELYETRSAKSSPNLRFVIVGDGHLRKKLEAETAALGLSRRLIFLGNRPDIASVYAGFDIVALTSLNEGTPLSLIEAMAANRPFIATSVGGVVDLLGAVSERKEKFAVHERGLAVGSGDAEGFLEGLIYLAENEKLRSSLATTGRLFVEKRYAKERLVADIKNLYRALQ